MIRGNDSVCVAGQIRAWPSWGVPTPVGIRTHWHVPPCPVPSAGGVRQSRRRPVGPGPPFAFPLLPSVVREGEGESPRSGQGVRRSRCRRPPTCPSDAAYQTSSVTDIDPLPLSVKVLRSLEVGPFFSSVAVPSTITEWSGWFFTSSRKPGSRQATWSRVSFGG